MLRAAPSQPFLLVCTYYLCTSLNTFKVIKHCTYTVMSRRRAVLPLVGDILHCDRITPWWWTSFITELLMDRTPMFLLNKVLFCCKGVNNLNDLTKAKSFIATFFSVLSLTKELAKINKRPTGRPLWLECAYVSWDWRRQHTSFKKNVLLRKCLIQAK